MLLLLLAIYTKSANTASIRCILCILFIDYKICTHYTQASSSLQSGSAAPVEMGPSLALLGHWPPLSTYYCAIVELYNCTIVQLVKFRITSNHPDSNSNDVGHQAIWFPSTPHIHDFLIRLDGLQQTPALHNCIIPPQHNHLCHFLVIGYIGKIPIPCQRPALGTPSYTNHRSV